MISQNTYQRKDGRWKWRVYTNCNKSGKTQYRSFYGKTREAAEAKAASYLQELCEASTAEMTVGQLAAEYLSVKTPQLKESTAANYRMKLEKHIIPALGKLAVCSVKAKSIMGKCITDTDYWYPIFKNTLKTRFYYLIFLFSKLPYR